MYQRGDRELRVLDYHQIQVGDEATLSHLLSQKDVDAFAALTGDFNPLHLDAEFAKRTLFRKPVVYGMLSASYISTMVGMLLPGSGALWTSQTLEFLQPAFVGDELTVRAKVKQKSPATRFLVLEVEVINQHGQKLIVGESTVKVLEPEEEKKKMSDDLSRVVLVTGGSRGIGAATCRKLAADGHKVILNFNSSEVEASALVKEIEAIDGKCVAIRANVADPAQVDTLFAKAELAFGPIQDVVHCSAPNAVPKPFGEMVWNDFGQHLDVQLKGAFNCAQRALPKMIEAQAGSFIFLGSIFSDGVPPTQQTGYVATKSALTSLARCLAVEYGPKGIRSNIVSPGMTQTDMIANIPEKTKMLAKMQTPLRRLGEPGDVANVISFLLSPSARHITGETIRVCGGIVMA